MLPVNGVSSPNRFSTSAVKPTHRLERPVISASEQTEEKKKANRYRLHLLPRGARLRKTTDLTPAYLKANAIKLLFVDWDNTFCATHSCDTTEEYTDWLKSLLKDDAVKVVFLSNDKQERAEIKAFAKAQGVEHVHQARKPFAQAKIRQFCKQYGVPLSQAAMVDENFATGGFQALFTPGLRFFWPDPINRQDPNEHWLFAKGTRWLTRLLFGWAFKPLNPSA